VVVRGQVHDDSLAARRASAGGLQATRRRRGRRRLRAVHVAGARPGIILGAERNDRRGPRRLQRPTLQYVRQRVTFPRDGTFPRQMMTCRPGLRWNGLLNAFLSSAAARLVWPGRGARRADSPSRYSRWSQLDQPHPQYEQLRRCFLFGGVEAGERGSRQSGVHLPRVLEAGQAHVPSLQHIHGEISRKVFSAHFGQLGIILVWLAQNDSEQAQATSRRIRAVQPAPRGGSRPKRRARNAPRPKPGRQPTRRHAR